jgi:hypothetical protein
MSDSRVQHHYGSSGIAARILAALRSVHGPDVSISPAALAPVDHFHGRGLDATRELAALLGAGPRARLPPRALNFPPAAGFSLSGPTNLPTLPGGQGVDLLRSEDKVLSTTWTLARRDARASGFSLEEFSGLTSQSKNFELHKRTQNTMAQVNVRELGGSCGPDASCSPGEGNPHLEI